MSIAEMFERVAEFEHIESHALDSTSSWTAFNAKLDLLEYLRDHEPMVYMAYQRTLGHPPTAVS